MKVVTVFAFSIENFNRPKPEVEGLMLLAKTKLVQLVQHGELMERYDARIKACGKLDLVPEDVLEILEKAVDATSKNTGYVALPQTILKLFDMHLMADILFQSRSEPLLSLRLQGRDDPGSSSYRQ